MIAVLAWGSREGASPIMATRRTPPRLGAPIAGAWALAGERARASQADATAHVRMPARLTSFEGRTRAALADRRARDGAAAAVVVGSGVEEDGFSCRAT